MRTEAEILELIAALEDKIQHVRAAIRYESGKTVRTGSVPGIRVNSLYKLLGNLDGQLSALRWVNGGDESDQFRPLRAYRHKLRQQKIDALLRQ